MTDVDVDGSLDASEAEIRNALESLTLAGDQLRLAAAGLPEQALTWPQTLRRATLVAAVAVAQRALKDALGGRAQLSEVADAQSVRWASQRRGVAD